MAVGAHDQQIRVEPVALAEQDRTIVFVRLADAFERSFNPVARQMAQDGLGRCEFVGAAIHDQQPDVLCGLEELQAVVQSAFGLAASVPGRQHTVERSRDASSFRHKQARRSARQSGNLRQPATDTAAGGARDDREIVEARSRGELQRVSLGAAQVQTASTALSATTARNAFSVGASNCTIAALRCASASPTASGPIA